MLKKQFYLVHAGLPLLYIVLLLIIFELTSVDIYISDWFYDSVNSDFPLRRNHWFELIAHHWLKYVPVLIALSLLLSLIVSMGVKKLKPLRRRLIFLLLSMIVGTEIMGYLKDIMNTHCPYDLAIYAGTQPYVRLFESAIAAGQTELGRCFPASHASAGFVLMAFYFIWFRSNKKLAYTALVAGYAYGTILGFSRIMQGAHFLSHNMWSAVVCWYVALFFYLVLNPDKNRKDLIG